MDDDRVTDIAGEKMTLHGLLQRAGLRWAEDTPEARIAAYKLVSQFLEKPRLLSSAECDTLVDEYLRGGIR